MRRLALLALLALAACGPAPMPEELDAGPESDLACTASARCCEARARCASSRTAEDNLDCWARHVQPACS